MTHKELQTELEKLTEMQNTLRQAYIKEHAKYQIGDRLLLNDKVQAEVVANKVESFSGEVEPIAQKVKKDGTLSSVRAYIWGHTKVEKLNQ